MCKCVCGTSTVHTGGVGETGGCCLGSQRKVLAPGGLSSPLALGGLGKPCMETVGWKGGGRGVSVEANEQRRC